MFNNYKPIPLQRAVIYLAEGVEFTIPEPSEMPPDAMAAITELDTAELSLCITRHTPTPDAASLVSVGVCLKNAPDTVVISPDAGDLPNLAVKYSHILLHNIERRLDTDFPLLPLSTHSIDEVLNKLPSRDGVIANDNVVYIELSEAPDEVKTALREVDYMEATSKAQLTYALNSGHTDKLTLKISKV